MCCCDVEGLILRIEQSGTKAHLFIPCYALDLIERLLKAETHPVWLFILRLKVHPNVPNANLPNLTDFPNPNVPGLI